MNGGFKLLNNFCILGNAVTKAVAISSPVRLPDVNTKTATPAYCPGSIRDLSLSECPVQKERGWVKQLRVGALIG